MTIKVISLNLWNGGTLLEEIIIFLQQQNADILALQEVYNGEAASLKDQFRSFEVIKHALRYSYSDFAPAFLDNRQEGIIPQGNAIFSKFPITDRDVTFFNGPFSKTYVEIPENFPLSPRNLQHVIIKTRIGNVNMFNIHGVWDLWDLDGDNYSERRQRMSEVILESIKDKTNIILTGDTNAKPTNQAMRNVERHLKSVFGETIPTTFNMRRKNNPGYATAVVDMMFISSNVQVITHTVPDVDISDHLSLIAILKI